MVLRLAALLPRHRMGVVEAIHQPGARRQGRAASASNPARAASAATSAPVSPEPDPMAALRVHDEHLAVEVEQAHRGGGARLRHDIELSY